MRAGQSWAARYPRNASALMTIRLANDPLISSANRHPGIAAPPASKFRVRVDLAQHQVLAVPRNTCSAGEGHKKALLREPRRENSKHLLDRARCGLRRPDVDE